MLQVYQQVLGYKCTKSVVLHLYQHFIRFIVIKVRLLLLLQVYQQVLNEQCQSLMESLVSSIAADRSAMENISSSGDVNKLMYRVNGVR